MLFVGLGLISVPHIGFIVGDVMQIWMPDRDDYIRAIYLEKTTPRKDFNKFIKANTLALVPCIRCICGRVSFSVVKYILAIS